MFNKLYFTLFTFLIGLASFAQPMRKGTVKNDSTSFKIQTNYLSNYVYNGRSDSIKAPYFYDSNPAKIIGTEIVNFVSPCEAVKLFSKNSQLFNLIVLAVTLVPPNTNLI